MAIFKFPDGVQLDLATGQIVGQAEPKQLTPTEARQPSVDIPAESAGQGAVDALKKFSEGFNTALFSLPDAAIQAVGRAAGVKEEEIPNFTAYFNRGATAPKNATERFASALGQGAGSTIPFTGLLGVFAKTRALAAPLAPNAPITKQIAKDMLDFIRTNPKLAVATDLGFGAAYGGVEQAVEEYVSPGPEKEILKATVPLGATVALPYAGAKILGLAGKLVSISPTAQLAKVAGAEMFGTQTAEGYAAELAGQRALNIPFLRSPSEWAFKKYGLKAERDVKEVLSQLSDQPGRPAPPGVKDALKVTADIESDPRLAGLFLFDAAEQSLYPAILAARNKAVGQLTGEQLTREQLRQQQNEQGLLEAFRAFAPNAQVPLEDALRLAYAQSTKSVDDALRAVAGLRDDEITRLADVFVPQNLDEIGDSLRRSMLAQMEGQFYKLRNSAQQLGMRTGFDVEGIRIPVREGGEPTIPGVGFEKFANDFKRRFKLTADERMFPQGTPSPVEMVNRELGRLENARNKKLSEILPNMLREKFKSDPFISRLNPDDQAVLIENLTKNIMSGKTAKKTRGVLPQAEEMFMAGVRGPSEKDMAALMKEARQRAIDETDFSITVPESLDLLESALKYRNYSILRANKEMDAGNTRYNAQAVIDRGNAVLRDVENFVFSSFRESPAMRDWVDTYKQTYTNGYEKLFPMMATRRAPGGDFYVSNEKVVNQMLSSADNVRNMNAIFNNGEEYQRTLQKVMFDRALKQNVMRDGVLDPAKYQRFLSSNKNLIDAMPEGTQAVLKDELVAGEGFAKRMKEMEDRVQVSKDDELLGLLKKAVRPDADPKQLVNQAITDPAVMRKLVSTVGAEPARMESLRRQVWLTVRDKLLDPSDPVFLDNFIKQNGKSLNILYTPQHMDDLRKLAEIQRRVFAGERVVGRLSPFRGLDEQLRERIGAGVGTIESTTRAAMIRQISPFHAAVSLLTRYMTRQQTAIYESVLYKALTDPNYAHQLVNASDPINSKKSFNTMSNLTFRAGGYLPALLKAGVIEGVQTLEPETPRPLPQPEFTQGMAPAPQAPAVPAARGPISQSPVQKVVPRMPAMPNRQPLPGQVYQALFPGDVVGPLLQQRQQTPPQ